MNSKCSWIAQGPGIFLLCLLMLTGLSCAASTTSNVAVGEIWEGEEGDSLEKDYVIKDSVLARKIEILDVKARFTGDFLEGLVIVRNRKKKTIPFEVKFEWFDEDGFPIESNVSHWTPELLYGQESKWLKSVCPRPKAKGFKVMIRQPNPIEE